ncbi:hypothetical protein EUGRSUZ_C00407 [Eucalyptus grandis]|uniref:Uncharacterized protein n=2 Tax=Eucalyptus grandis TaxID=71139 RepID=A0ACC3L9Y9_EUCGR|nr:hypothetical protein EUGRSUZ_C00407 [Eucalyptus grandis]
MILLDMFMISWARFESIQNYNVCSAQFNVVLALGTFRLSASTTPPKLSNLWPTTSTPTPSLSAPAAVTGPCAATTSSGHLLLTSSHSHPKPSLRLLSRPSTSPLLVKTIASNPSPPSPPLLTIAPAQSSPSHRVSYAATLTAAQPFASRSPMNSGTTGGSSIPTTRGTGQRILLPSPRPSESASPRGLATWGTSVSIRRGSAQILDRRSASRSSESLPRAATTKAPPSGPRSGAGRPARAAEKAAMPAREVKATAEKGSSAGGRRWERREETVCGVGPTERVGHQSGAWPLRARRRESRGA